MYVESLVTKVTEALQAQAEISHDAIVDNVTHLERLGWMDTIRQMEKDGLVVRALVRDERGKLRLVYRRVGT